MPNFVVLCFKEIVNINCHIRFIFIEGKHRFVKCDADTYKHYYIFLNKTKFHSYNHLTPHPSHIPPRKSSIYWLAVESLKYHRRHQSVRRITRTDRAECVTLMALSSLSAIPTIAPPPKYTRDEKRYKWGCFAQHRTKKTHATPIFKSSPRRRMPAR